MEKRQVSSFYKAWRISRALVLVFGLFASASALLVGLVYGLALLLDTIGLRVSEAEELECLDIGEHGMSAYPDFITSAGSVIFGGLGQVTPVSPSPPPPRPSAEHGPLVD